MPRLRQKKQKREEKRGEGEWREKGGARKEAKEGKRGREEKRVGEKGEKGRGGKPSEVASERKLNRFQHHSLAILEIYEKAPNSEVNTAPQCRRFGKVTSSVLNRGPQYRNFEHAKKWSSTVSHF